MTNKSDMNQVPLTSTDDREVRIDTLRRLFPDLFDLEGVLDEKALRALLADDQANVGERFRFEWAGKQQSKRFAFSPSRASLAYLPEQSMGSDGSVFKATSRPQDNESRNVFIEGDNLEVLKLLEKSLFEQIQCIYIDPPYNADADVLYLDDYSESQAAYWERTGQSKDGIRLQAVTTATGRRHSNWLNILQARLARARNLLADSGVIIVHIDDKELANLRKLMDELFGEDNFLGTVIWKNATDNNPTRIAIEHEYLLVFAKNATAVKAVWKAEDSAPKAILIKIGDELTSKYSDLDELKAAYAEWFNENRTQLSPLDRYRYIDHDGVYTGSQSVHNPGKEGYRYDVFHPDTKKACKQPLMGYRFPKETMEQLLLDDKILFGDDEDKIVELKVYARDYKARLSSVFNLDGRLGSYDLKALFPEFNQPFRNPKPVSLVKEMLEYVTDEGDIVLDFFAGSGTTAHAVYELISEGRPRSFVSVQLPEPTPPGHEMNKAGYKYISDITRERIKRAGKSFLADGLKGDFGFRTFTLTQSNFPENTFMPDPVKSDVDNMKALDEHLSASRQKHIFTDNALASVTTEIALKFGFGLFYETTSLAKDFAKNHIVKIVGNAKSSLMCLDDDLHETTIEKLKLFSDEQLIVAESALDTTKKFELQNAFKDNLWTV